MTEVLGITLMVLIAVVPWGWVIVMRRRADKRWENRG